MITNAQQAFRDAREQGKTYEEALAAAHGLTLEEYKAKQARDAAESKIRGRIVALQYTINVDELDNEHRLKKLERLRKYIAQLQNQGDELVGSYLDDEKTLVAEIDANNHEIASLRLMLDALPSPAAVATLSDDELNQALAVVDAQLAVEQKNNAIDGAKTNSELKAMEDYNMSDTMNQAISNLPTEFLSQRRFFRAKVKDGGKKVPCLKAWSKPENQSMWHDVKGLVGFDVSGHGVADDYLFLDFDHVLDDNGNFINETAATCFSEVYSKLGGFCERSISGHGLHLFGKPTKGKFNAISNGKNGVLFFDKVNDVKLELFYMTRGRYCLMTGNLFNCEPNAPVAQGSVVDEVLQDLLNKIAEQNHSVEKTTTKPARKQEAKKTVADLPLDYDLFRAEIMLDAINPADLSDTDWLAVISSCKHIGVPYYTVDAFNRRDSNRYDERENQRRWDSATDTRFNIETLHGIAKRFRYEEKDAQREWFNRHPELSTPMNDADNFIGTKDIISDCPINLRLPQNFEFGNGGIRYVTSPRGKDDQPKVKSVTRTPLVITKVFTETKTFSTQYEVAMKIAHAWRYMTVDGEALLDSRRVGTLNGKGVLIEEPSILTKFFARLIALNQDTITRTKVYTQPGWHDGKFIYPVSEDASYICRRSNINYEELFTTSGNADAWKQKFRDVIGIGKHSALKGIVIGGALAAPLLKILLLPNFWLHIQGQRNYAKTPLLKFALSIYGNPIETYLLRSFDSSPKNRVTMAVAMNDLPQAIDELETLSPKETAELQKSVYDYCSGIDGQKNQKNGDVREVTRFRGVRISTGERPILEQNAKGGALKRCVALHVTRPLFDDETAHQLHRFCEMNHGHFGRLWTNYISEHADQILADYDRMLADNRTETANFEPAHVRAVTACACALFHFRLMLNLEQSFDCHNAESFARLVIRNLPTKDDISDVKRGIELLSSWIDAHPKNFIHETENGALDSALSFNETSGIIYHDGRVALYATPFRRICEEELHLPGYEKFLNELYDESYLDCNARRDKRKSIKLGGAVTKAYLFKAGVLVTIEDASEEELGGVVS